jgi:hypothetical protein
MGHLERCNVNYWKTLIKVKVTLRLTASQPVFRCVEPTLGLGNRYYILYEGCLPKVSVFSLWGALSDERSGLIFVSLSL